MAAADHGKPAPDLYWLLGIAREASPGEIARAWRRRALAEHPDRRPRDAAAPARFRALAEAYRVLGDPARRAAYDRSLEDHGAAAPETLAARAAAGGVPEPPLRAGPAWVEVPQPPASPRAASVDLAALAVLAELALRYPAVEGRPW